MKAFILALVLAFALVTLAPARAQAPPEAPAGVSYVVGGEPGVRAFLDGVDLASADRSHALDVDPGTPANLSFEFAPPPGVTWELREIRVSLLVGGPGSGGVSQSQSFNATLPPGFTVFVNRTIDLGAVQKVGAGLFLMRVDVLDENATAIHAQEFYVHIHGNVLLSVSGAVATGVTVATGFGLWQVLKDLREVYKARERHRKRTRHAGRLEQIASAAVALGSDGVEGAVDVAGDADADAERMGRRRPLAWAATGLGLGGVGLSWAQFLGYAPFDLASTLIAALAVAAVFLSGALLAVALLKRLARSRTVRLVPTSGERPAEKAFEGRKPRQPGPR